MSLSFITNFADSYVYIIETNSNNEYNATMTPNELGKKAIEKFNKRITAEIFLVIQNDKGLMHDYLRLIESK